MATDYSKMLLDEALGTFSPDVPKTITDDKDKAPKPETTSVGQNILRSLRDAAYSGQSGFFTGLSAIPGVFGDVETLARQVGGAMGYDVDPRSVFPTTKQYTEMAIPRALGATYEPKTTTGRMVKTPVEFAAAMMGGGPVVGAGKELTKQVLRTAGRDVAQDLPKVAGPSLARQALQSAPLRIGAPAGLTAAGFTEATDSEAIGGVAGGAQAVAQSLIQARTRPAAAARMMREALQDAKIKDGKTLEAQAKRIGVPLTAAETLDAPKLRTLAADVARSQAGRAILEPRLSGRQKEIAEATRRGLLEVDEAPIRPTGMAMEAQKTASEAIRRVEKARTNFANRAGYGKLSEALVPDEKSRINSIIESIESEAASAPKGGKIQKAAKKFKTLLDTPEDVSVTARNLEQVRSEMQAYVDANKKAVGGTIGPLVTDLKKILEDVPEFRAGKAAYAKFSNTIMNDFDATGIRSMAQEGVTANRVANLISNPDLVGPEDIKKIAKAMNKQNPKTFPKIVKFLMESEADKALSKAKSGEKVEAALRKTGRGEANMNELLRGVALAKKQDPEQLVTGINNMLDVLGRTTEVPKFSSIEPVAPDVPSTVAGAVKRITGAEVTRPAGLLSDVIEKPSEVAYRTIAKALASDDSIDAVIRLANMNPNSQQAKNIVGSLMGASAVSQSGLLAGD